MAKSLSGDDLELLARLKAGLAIVDPAGMVVLWNDDAARILGIAPSDAIGTPWVDCLTLVRGDRTGGATLRQQVQRGGWHGPLHVRTRGGGTIWLRAHIQPIELPQFKAKAGVAAMFWNGDDPEILGPAAGQLPYRDLFLHSAEALFLTDLDTIIIDANEAGAAMLRTSVADLIGLVLIGFTVEPTAAGAAAARAELLAVGSLVRRATFQPPTGEPFPAEMIFSLASPSAGHVLVRVRDRTLDEQLNRMVGDLAALANLDEGTLTETEVAQRGLDVVAATWHTAAIIAFLDGPDGFVVVAGSDTPETVRATLTGVDPARSPLALFVNKAGAPIEMELGRAGVPAWAARARSLGLSLLRTAPLFHHDRRLGAMVLVWAEQPPVVFDARRLEQMGRYIGLAIDSVGVRETVRHEAALRENLAGWARIGGIVVEQMAEAVVTIDARDRITAVNPAAEILYGFSEEEAVGHRLDEMLEQLQQDGSPQSSEGRAEASAMGYWHGRVVHRPLKGSLVGRHIYVDLSLTSIRDDKHKPAGLIAMSRAVAASSQLGEEPAALGPLAVATGRARSRREVADAAIERLCEATTADAGLILTWSDRGDQGIEAARGLSHDLVEAIRRAHIPALRAALEAPGAIVAFESLPSLVEGTEVAAALAREGFATGFLVGLRSMDESIGFLGLGARRPAWGRPGDQTILQAAAQVVSALENARLMERLASGLEQERRLTAKLETLMGLTLLPQGESDESTLALFLLERIVSTLGAVGGFAVRTADEDRLRVIASLLVKPLMIKTISTRPASSFDFWERLNAYPGAGAFHHNLGEGTDPTGEIQRMRDRGVASYAAFPIRDGARLIGAFLCYFSGSAEDTAAADERTIDAVGRIVSIAYTNVRMSEGLNEAAEHERRLTAELRALQELTLLGATTDDFVRLAQETIEAVVVSTGASGGGYALVDPSTSKLDPIVWVGQSSQRWQTLSESLAPPPEWPPIDRLQSERRVWLARDDEVREASDAERSIGAQAVLPLRVGDELAGALHLEWSASPRVEQFDDHFLEPIARICSIGLANFRLRSELVHRAAAQRGLSHRLDTLDELTRIGEEASSFEELAHRTVGLVREALGANGVCYMLIEPGRHFETHAVAGEIGGFRQWLKTVPSREAPGGSMLLAGGGSVLSDFAADEADAQALPAAAAVGFRSFGAIPIRTGEELAGALLCLFEQPVAALPLDEAALDSVARIGGIALANFRLRERLVSSEERYRTLFEESPDAIFVSALDGTLLDANEAAVRLYHVNRAEVLGRYFGQLVSADEREMARRRQVVWAQGRGTFSDRGRRSDGSEFPVEVEVRVVELGGQRRFLSLVRDLSDQERLTSELLQAQKMEAIGQLVSGVAHELNNPLAAIIAFSQLIRGDQRLPEDMRHDAGLLVQEADRTRRIVQNLLDFARQRPPERRQTSIATLVRSVLELQSYALNTNRVQVSVEIPEDLPEVDLDRAQMQQVLLNLTINAIQAIRTRDRTTPAHIWVGAQVARARRGPGGPKADKLTDDQQRVRITVRDDGPGVPESARGRLFDPFFTTKQPGEGTGLGLSVSFGIVAAHGGHLWYEPGPAGGGSSFLIELPVRARPMNELQVRAIPEIGAVREAPAARQAPEPASKPFAAAGSGAAGSGNSPKAEGKRARSGSAPPKEPLVAPRRSRAGAEGAATGSAQSAASVSSPDPAAAAPGDDAVRATVEPAPRPRVLALDDEPSIRVFLKKVLAASNMDCDSYQDGAQALEGIRDTTYDVMLIDHRMAGMSGTEFYEAAVEFRPELARRAIFMSGDVLNPDLRGFATERSIRLLAKPFDIDAVIRVVREAIASAKEHEIAAGQ